MVAKKTPTRKGGKPRKFPVDRTTVALRMDPAWHQQLARYCADAGEYINEYLNALITADLKAKGYAPKVRKKAARTVAPVAESDES
ncbi:hypothetical protein KEX41_29670 (plasmid) [Burkholderia thailandensis]|uniref:hypothetical protein n=1 Tax=Burkholderia thailandensis TaxID=57975 RepID=UPI00192D2EC9|nr:hypothetical protein [Burkholderia thailandensis]MBS2132353.1 hypothetical protein [Burkholderia thailandensis]QRA15158.1 hypothetical protein JMY07_30095 [Burkholderia thailandensis]